jgi:hypothetical protein
MILINSRGHLACRYGCEPHLTADGLIETDADDVSRSTLLTKNGDWQGGETAN